MLIMLMKKSQVLINCVEINFLLPFFQNSNELGKVKLYQQKNHILTNKILWLKCKPKLRLEEEEDKNEAVNKDQPPQKKVQYVKSWRYKDIQDTNGLSGQQLPGATRDIYDFPTALFEQFITDEIVDQINKEANSYAALKGNHSFKLDPKEFNSFITVLLLSSYIPYPRHSTYWEMTGDSRNTIVTSLFNRKQFLDVIRILHLAHINNLDASDKFTKVGLMFNMLNENYLKDFIPERNISINESMVPCHGRHGCRQYMQSKPVHFGYKLWIKATTRAYATQFCPYADKHANYNKELGLGAMWLCRQFLNCLQSQTQVTMQLQATFSQVRIFFDC